MKKKTISWKNDNELFRLIHKHLYTPVVGDILDQAGFHHQFLPPQVRPLLPTMKVAGRAMPVLMKSVSKFPKNLFANMITALDDLKKNEVYLGTGAHSFTPNCANWGEIMTAAAVARKAAGAVVCGYHRDTPGILSQKFPVFSIGAYAQDAAPRMEVVAHRVPVKIKSEKTTLTINPGDIVFGDIDGVIIIPQTQEKETITLSLEKALGEKTVLREVTRGDKVADVFNRHKIL